MDQKTIEKMGCSVINLSKNINTYPGFIRNIKGWINYGENNYLPQRIIDLNNESAVNKSIIENKIIYICGSGLNDAQYYGQLNTLGDCDTLIEKIAKDYITFGSFCFQVILNEDHISMSLYHTDFCKIRVGEISNYRIPQNFYLSNDWQKTTGRYAPTQIKAYRSEMPRRGIPYFYYYKDYEASFNYYPVPHYYSTLNYIETDGPLGKFYRSSINNGFAFRHHHIPSNPGEEAKVQFNRDMTQTFTGTNGANSIGCTPK